jgi:hypothetical protein
MTRDGFSRHCADVSTAAAAWQFVAGGCSGEGKKAGLSADDADGRRWISRGFLSELSVSPSEAIGDHPAFIICE